MGERAPNRWLIAAAGVVMQVALGGVYAWSVFRKPLSKEYGTEVATVNIAFTLTIVFLGLAAYFGGLWMQNVGPRRVAMTAGLLYGAGIILTSFADAGVGLLYVTYGVIAGIGIGLGYIVPIATLIKWFPDKRGIITGIAVGGFGAGALITAPVAERLIDSAGLFETFAILGVAYVIAVVGASLFLRNPPEGYKPEGWEPPPAEETVDRSGRDYEFGDAVRRWQWYALWGLLFLNTTAGIAILSDAAAMTEDIAKVSAAQAATLVGLLGIFNGAGRFLWASLSDAIGRKWVFLALYLVQAVAFFVLPGADSYGLFLLVAGVILLCYGGGFGTMPAFAADYFGSKNVGRIYGLMLTAWSAAGIAGPLLVSIVKDSSGKYDGALYALAVLMLASSALAVAVRPPRGEPAGGRTPEPEPAGSS